MERQEDQLEDELLRCGSKSSAVFQAGGIDGGFSSQQELLDLLSSSSAAGSGRAASAVLALD